MLKRQRVPSPIPDPPQVPYEVPLDIHERVVKRRRHLAPPSNDSRGDGSTCNPGEEGDEDEETWLLDEGRPEYSRGTSKWQEEAGLYKAANTLLHDLHAEQTHRMIFSSSVWSSSTPSTTQEARQGQPWTHPTKFTSPPPLRELPVVPDAQQFMKHTIHYHADAASERALPIADAEVRSVTQRYEDTNRFIGSLFLNRRRILDTQDGQQDSI